MRIHRFFIKENIGNSERLTIKDEAFIHQLKRVFRYEIGDRVVLFDGSGLEYVASIEMIARSELVFCIESSKKGLIPKREISLCFSLVKKDNNDWIIQKATELGVLHIYPIVSERSEKKDLNLERAEKIAIEASEQSGWSVIPIVHPVSDIQTVLESTKEQQKIVFDTHTENLVSQTASVSISEKNQPIIIFIGPEGGWSDQELALFKASGFTFDTLGLSVLRAETAVVVALAKFV